MPRSAASFSWDVMRQSGNQYREHLAETAPHVLDYEAELVVDGRTLDRPVNYALVRIVPPEGVTVDPARRPFVVVDPRAGHGPGIGGFKADSEIGVAFKAGHPCYFVGFLPEPMPGQTLRDIARAEAIFLEKVIALHPKADGKPCVIGNCQAGWAIMILAALRPELFGPIIIAGSPLSYWAGVRGKNPMRYSGGLLGGSWLTALTSDLGHGKFDGAWLVQNFESQNPANTLWTKRYNLYSKDRHRGVALSWLRALVGRTCQPDRRGNPVDRRRPLRRQQACGRRRCEPPTAAAIDLRNIRSPIVVFCSKGDNITPPQQALGWILDLYEDVDDIRSHGQTIVYTIHDSVGHLGIFVSAGVARKEHDEFSSNIDLIDVLAAGSLRSGASRRRRRTRSAPTSSRANGSCAAKRVPSMTSARSAVTTLADERRFATAARVSEINLALYRAFAQPMVRAMTSAPIADAMRQLHPLRLQYELFSDANPLMAPVKAMAERAREDRQPASADNPFLALQETISKQIVASLDAWRDTTESLSESMFLSIYGSPALQAAVGIDPTDERPLRKAETSPLHRELLQSRIAELRSRIATGGLRECLVRGLLYVGMERGHADERGLAAIRGLRTSPGR